MALAPMTTSRTGLSGRPRRRTIARIRAQNQPCHLCGYPIDQTLDKQRHPLASTIDELIPRARNGDPLDEALCRHAHRVCNSMKGKQPVTPELHTRCRTKVAELIGLPAPNPTTTRTW